MKNLVNTLTLVAATLVTASPAFAQEAAAHGSGNGLVALGAAIAIGLAAMGGALGQGKAASSALDGIARNPGASDKVFTPLVIGLALIESLVLLSFVIAFFLQAKV